jgi:hypothetical protein
MMPLPKMSAYRSWIAPYNYVQNIPVMRHDPKGIMHTGGQAQKLWGYLVWYVFV